MDSKGRRESSQSALLQLSGKLLGLRPFYAPLVYIFECFRELVISRPQVRHFLRESRYLATERFRWWTITKLIKMVLCHSQFVLEPIDFTLVGVNPIVKTHNLSFVFFCENFVFRQILDPLPVKDLTVNHHRVTAARLVGDHVFVNLLEWDAEWLVVHLALNDDQEMRRLGIHHKVVEKDRVPRNEACQLPIRPNPDA